MFHILLEIFIFYKVRVFTFLFISSSLIKYHSEVSKVSTFKVKR